MLVHEASYSSVLHTIALRDMCCRMLVEFGVKVEERIMSFNLGRISISKCMTIDPHTEDQL